MSDPADPARTGVVAGRVVGSLVGVAYDALDEPPVVALVLGVLAVGIVDGAVAYVDTRSTLIGSCVSVFSTGCHCWRVHGLTHKTSDARAVTSHARPYHSPTGSIAKNWRLMTRKRTYSTRRSAPALRDRVPRQRR